MAGRGIGYTNAEDVILCETYLEITQDSIVGRYQSTDRFWNVWRRFTMNELATIMSIAQFDHCSLA